MTPPKIGIVYGVLMVVVGVAGWLVTGMESLTALLPAIAGTLVGGLAWWASKNDGLRKHLMHGVSVLLLLVIVGSGMRLPGAFASGTPVADGGAAATTDDDDAPRPGEPAPPEAISNAGAGGAQGAEGSEPSGEASARSKISGVFLLLSVVLSVIALGFMVRSFIAAAKARRAGEASGGTAAAGA